MSEDHETDGVVARVSMPSKSIVMPKQRSNLFLRIVLWVFVLLLAIAAAFFAAYIFSGSFKSFPAMLQWIWNNLVG
jgi:ABC-type transport system involved in multi-copper enzyme maturation permease subunit